MKKSTMKNSLTQENGALILQTAKNMYSVNQ
jgi:hypothetical protein